MPSHVRALIIDEMMYCKILFKCIDQTLRLYNHLNSKDFVGFESGAGYVPGDPRDPVGTRLIRHLISVMTRLILNVDGVVLRHTDTLLSAIVYLFMGGDGDMITTWKVLDSLPNL